MSLKAILAHLNDSERSESRLETALRLAVEFRAQLIGAYLVEDTEISPSLVPMLPPDIVARRQREAMDAQQASENCFRRVVVGANATNCEWRAPAGAPIDAVIAHGRCSDLVVMGQPGPDDPDRPFDQELIMAALMSTGRPTLVIPYVGTQPSLGENVLVAWDGGREASRALADAMPFLERAKQVTVVAVNSGSNVHRVNPQAMARLSSYLQAHGVAFRHEHDELAEPRIGDWLLSRAADLGSDLIVMGAYAHTRLREFAFGGVTRSMLEAMTVPVLMSH